MRIGIFADTHDHLMNIGLAVPTAGHSIEAARASYVAGNLDFLRLIESQRQLLMQKGRYYEAIAPYHQRLQSSTASWALRRQL